MSSGGPLPVRLRRQPARRAGAVILTVLLAGCAQDGDFGRRQPSALDPLANALGDRAALQRGEPVSGFLFTDAETRLRDRAWRFLMPAAPRPVFDTLLANLRRSRILPTNPFPGIDDRPDVYVAELLAQNPRSSHSPYRRLIDDMAADRTLLDPLCDSVLEVRAADGIRAQSLAYASELPAGDRDRARARIAENGILVQWVGETIGRRLAAYRYGLHRLFIELPEQDAVAAERGFSALEYRVTRESCFAAGALTASSRRASVIGEDGAIYKP